EAHFRTFALSHSRTAVRVDRLRPRAARPPRDATRRQRLPRGADDGAAGRAQDGGSVRGRVPGEPLGHRPGQHLLHPVQLRRLPRPRRGRGNGPAAERRRVDLRQLARKHLRHRRRGAPQRHALVPRAHRQRAAVDARRLRAQHERPDAARHLAFPDGPHAGGPARPRSRAAGPAAV
ncbi:MAG: Cytochrome c oxidase polypeptide III, partial [uncultured Gemmatimonadetes bacterium]